MSNRLFELIELIPKIESCFHIIGGEGLPRTNVIYDIQEFQDWKQEIQFELMEILENKHDPFIEETLSELTQKWVGWHDESYFSSIKAKLKVISHNMEKYKFPEGEDKKMNKSYKVFISHSSKDKDSVCKIVDLLNVMGLNEKQIFCSSYSGYGIPEGEDLFAYLKKQIQNYDLHCIVVHSHNYYSSPISLNEMGAAWVLNSRCTSILLPGFELEEMKGVINSNSIVIKFDDDLYCVKGRLNDLYESIISEFNLQEKNRIIWEQKRDDLIREFRKNGEE